MTTPDVRTATELAAIAAAQAHGSVPHGDNDPAATDHLKAVAAAVNVLVPRIEKPSSGRAMCSDWGYQQAVKSPAQANDELAYPQPGELAVAAQGLARLVRRRRNDR